MKIVQYFKPPLSNEVLCCDSTCSLIIITVLYRHSTMLQNNIRTDRYSTIATERTGTGTVPYYYWTGIHAVLYRTTRRPVPVRTTDRYSI